MDWSDLFCVSLLQYVYVHRCRTARTLVEAFPEPADLLKLSKREISHWIPDENDQATWFNPEIRHQLEAELQWCTEHKIALDYLHDPNYPKRLKECPDAPILLRRLGSGNPSPRRCLAIVGTRNATPYGKSFARQLVQSAAALDPAPVIISGLAYGIDIEAHRAALDFGLETQAVFANGLDTIYPSSHRNTAKHIVECGLLWSEFPQGTPSYPLHFLQRNRIIAGLSDATVLCESARQGGGMATARIAASYSREVFALPGRVSDPKSAGCNDLIRNQTAQVLTSPEQLWKSLGWEKSKKKKQVPEELSIFGSPSDLSQTIVRLLTEHLHLTPDQLLEHCPNASLQDLSIALTALELEGLIRQQGGGYEKQ